MSTKHIQSYLSLSILYINTYVSINKQTYIYIYIYVCTYICIYIHTRGAAEVEHGLKLSNPCLQVHARHYDHIVITFMIYIYICIHTTIIIYNYLLLYTHIHIHICMYIYIYIHNVILLFLVVSSAGPRPAWIIFIMLRYVLFIIFIILLHYILLY